MGTVEETHGPEIVGQNPQRLRIVTDVEHDGRPARDYLEASRQLGLDEAGSEWPAWLPAIGRQGFPGRRGRRRHWRAGSARAVRDRPGRASSSSAGDAPPAPLQTVFRIALVSELAADATEVGTDDCCVVDERLRRPGIGAEGRPPERKMPAFSKPMVSVRAQPLGMVEIDGRDDGNVGFVGIDGIQATAQADFENRRLDPGRRKHFPRRQVPNSK